MKTYHWLIIIHKLKSSPIPDGHYITDEQSHGILLRGLSLSIFEALPTAIPHIRMVTHAS